MRHTRIIPTPQPPDGLSGPLGPLPCGEHAQSGRPKAGLSATVERVAKSAKRNPAQRGLDVFCTHDTERCPVGGSYPALTDVLATEGFGVYADVPRRGRNIYTASAVGAAASGGWSRAGSGAYRCIRPIVRHLLAGEATPLGHSAEIEVRCRKCEPCRKAKSAFWKFRALAEIEAAPRTWFVTLTFTADQQYQAEAAARLRLAKRGVTKPTGTEVFRGSAEHLLRDVTKWLKRVRKGRLDKKRKPTRFRYLLVVEAHEGGGVLHGYPHAHLLIHETAAGSITKRRLQEAWLCGFSNAKLVVDDPSDDDDEAISPRKAAGYTAKYISKSPLARVRASQGYGIN